MPHSLAPLFDPHKVLLVGASETTLFSAGIARYLLSGDYADRLVMVNPKHDTVYGRPAFPSISAAAAQGPFDLAIMVIPAPHVVAAIEELAAIGCRLAIVESAGFAEIGAHGRELQEQLSQTARRVGVRVLGPNCVGVVNTANGFATTEVMPECMMPGGVAFVAQSGVFGSILLDTAAAVGMRFSKAITLGNRVDLDEADFLDYLAEDETTRVVAMYLEGVADGRRFFAAMRRCTARKPVVVLKGGRTPSGAHAVGSHTASLAGHDAVFTGALKQAGGIRAATLEELTDAAKAFDACPLPQGRRIGMVTTSGSQGILAADILHDHGLELASLAPATIQRIRALTPAWVPVGNPLDLGPSGVYAEGIAALLDDPNVDALMIIVAVPWGAIKETFESGAPISFLLGEEDLLRRAAAEKPVLVAHLGHPTFTAAVAAAVGDYLPIYPNSERAARALAMLASFRK
ncbi:MAG: CoA-binding protein [Candidatus Lernaella stagnicola]|nr:CoA-binding protein [Candidatus Lernaella stagnicola]